MTKKNYEAIAAILREYRVYPNWAVLEVLADYMESDNPRFSRERFLKACRGEDSKDSGRKVTYAR